MWNSSEATNGRIKVSGLAIASFRLEHARMDFTDVSICGMALFVREIDNFRRLPKRRRSNMGHFRF